MNAASAVHQTRVKLLIKGLTGLQPFLPKCGPPFHDCNHVKPFRVKMKPFGWNLKQKVNLNTLNNDGNILDCANIAVLCALFSFR